MNESTSIERCENHVHLPVAFVVLVTCFFGNSEKRSYIFHKRGGTANAKMQFQNQFEAVARDTAFARILVGKISDG